MRDSYQEPLGPRILMWFAGSRSDWLAAVVWGAMPWVNLAAGGTLTVHSVAGVGRWVLLAFGILYTLGASAILVATVINRRLWMPRYMSWHDLRIGLLAFLAGISSLLGTYSFLYWKLSQWNHHAFSEALTKIDATYFTVTIFTTTGFGDIHPDTGSARLLVTTQMLLAMFILTVVIAAAVSRFMGAEPDDFEKG